MRRKRTNRFIGALLAAVMMAAPIVQVGPAVAAGSVTPAMDFLAQKDAMKVVGDNLELTKNADGSIDVSLKADLATASTAEENNVTDAIWIPMGTSTGEGVAATEGELLDIANNPNLYFDCVPSNNNAKYAFTIYYQAYQGSTWEAKIRHYQVAGQHNGAVNVGDYQYLTGIRNEAHTSIYSYLSDPSRDRVSPEGQIRIYGICLFVVGNEGDSVKFSKMFFGPEEPVVQQVATPTATPETKTFTSSVNVKLATTTEDAAIYYTLDGSAPTAESKTYDAETGIDLTATTTIKAIAVKEGMTDSAVAEFTYTRVDTVAAPTATPASGTAFDNTLTVTLTAETGAKIYYTLDGTAPTIESTLYDKAITLTTTTTIKAIAVKEGKADSAVANFTYTKRGKVATPEGISQYGETFADYNQIVLTCETEGAAIYYTLDGSEPTQSSLRAVDGVPFLIDKSCKVRAKAFADNMTASDEIVGTFTKQEQVATPKASYPDYWSFEDSLTVELTCATPGATIYYTIYKDSDSELDEVEYTGPITVEENCMISAYAVKDGMFPSEDGDYVYEKIDMGETLPAPAASVPSYTLFKDSLTVELSCPDKNAAIYYTTDGTEPTAESTKYTRPITVSESTEIYAIAVSGEKTSNVTELYYKEEIAVVKANPIGGTQFGSTLSVNLTSDSRDADIYYMLIDQDTVLKRNDTERVQFVTPEPVKYTGPITIKDTSFIIAVAAKGISEATTQLTNMSQMLMTGGVSAVASAMQVTAENRAQTIPTTSDVMFFGYFKQDIVSKPKATPAGGYSFNSYVDVQLTTETEDATIYYTLDGTTPTTKSSVYNGLIRLYNTTTLKAIAMKDGLANSDTLTAVYTYTGGGNYYYSGGSSTGGSTATGTISGTSIDARPSVYFTDMGDYQWASSSVDTLYEYGIVKGVTPTTYAPGKNISRADFLLLLVRTFKLEATSNGNFSDVRSDLYFADAVATAKALGIAQGDDRGLFNPYAAITREDMMVLTARTLEVAGFSVGDASELVLSNYDDADQISDYAKNAVAKLISNNIIAGTNGNILPKANTTRAESAVMIYRMVLKYGTRLIG